MSKYLNEEGLKAVWKKTKEKIAESCAEVDSKVDAVDDKAVANATNIAANTEAIEEVNAKVDAIEALSIDEINEVLVDLITFTVGNTEYQAAEGMTWREFCDSSYNTAPTGAGHSLYCNSNNEVENGYTNYCIKGVSADDVIVADTKYIFDL